MHILLDTYCICIPYFTGTGAPIPARLATCATQRVSDREGGVAACRAPTDLISVSQKQPGAPLTFRIEFRDNPAGRTSSGTERKRGPKVSKGIYTV